MNRKSDQVSLADAEDIIEALNVAIDSERSYADRITYLLNRLRQLLGREDAACALYLHDQLKRRRTPRVVQRFTLQSPLSNPFHDVDDVQGVSDDYAALHEILVPQALEHLRVPNTIVASEDADRAWFNSVPMTRYLDSVDCVDVIVSAWAASPDRKMDLLMFRHRPHAPFDRSDRTLVSLMQRGVGPLVDREVFGRSSLLKTPDLTTRQREVLGLLLCGDSEKEIAQQLHRSLNTVHTHVKEIYRAFSVHNRGQLMAKFIDKRLAEITQRIA